MATLHQLTKMDDNNNNNQRLSSSVVTANKNDIQLQNGAPPDNNNDINVLNAEFNNLNVHKDRNSVTKVFSINGH